MSLKTNGLKTNCLKTQSKILLAPLCADWVSLARQVSEGTLVGLAADEATLDAARERAEAEGFAHCMFVLGDLEEIPWQEAFFDRAYVSGVLSERGAWELSRVLVSRGATVEGSEMREMMQPYGFEPEPRRFLIVTYGSFGDLHPFLAVAIGLKQRGHHVTLASSENYRKKVESEGVEFVAVPPDLGWLEENEEARKKTMAYFGGTQYVIQSLILPGLEKSYEVLEPYARQADVYLASGLALAIPMLAEKLGKPWLAGQLQPSIMMSVEDPPVLPVAPWIRQLGPLRAPIFRTLRGVALKASMHFLQPAVALRAKLGIPSAKHPIFEHFSETANLGLFSRHFSAPAGDWQKPLTMCGFPFYDSLSGGAPPELSAGLEAFLATGEAPVVFTLGTSAVMDPGRFYDEAAKAIISTGRRAVFLVGRTHFAHYQKLATDRIYVCEYAPHSLLMPRASVNVHQGGIGTMGQALRAGRPMIVVPYAHDQPDNAARAVRLGVAATIGRNAFNAARLRKTLEGMRALEAKAAEIGALIRGEDAVGQACDVLEKVAATQPSRLGR
jgi:rhamnosyltransferase subunit B